MSYLREIMQKLGDSQPPEPAVQVGLYRRQLEACNEPMLLYEWAWQQQHLEDLRLCAANPAMLEVAGGQRHLEALLSTAEAALQELLEVFAAREIVPRRLPHSLAPTEHAWEVTHQGIRAQWGLDDPGAPG
jgi:hypothetical protein